MRRYIAVALTLGALLGAAWLLLMRGDLDFETLEAEYALADSEYLTLGPGEHVHFTDTGPDDATAIVLVHGFSASLHTWQAWREDLERDHRVITLDLPGHGLTRMPADAEPGRDLFIEVVDAVTEAREVERFVLVGSSMGGRLAWNYTLERPDRVAALVLVGASGWPEPEGTETPLVFRLIENQVTRSVMKNLDLTMLFRSGLKDSFVDEGFVTDEMVRRYARLARAPGHRDMLLALMTTADQGPDATPGLLADIEVPTLVLHGAGDKLVPVEGGRRFAESIDGAQLVIYEGVGHLPHEEISAESLSDLRGFLADKGLAQSAVTGSQEAARRELDVRP